MNEAPTHEIGAPALRGHRVSLRVRLTLWMVGLFSMIACTMLGVFYLYEKATIESRIEDAVSRYATDIADEIALKLPGLTDSDVAEVQRDRHDIFPSQPLVVEVFDQSGARVAGDAGPESVWDALPASLVPWTRTPVIRALPRSTLKVIPPEARVAQAATVGIVGADGRRYAVVVFTSDALFRRRVALLTGVAAAGAVIGILAAGATGWFIAGVAVAPFDRLRSLAQRLEPGAEPSRPPHVSPASDAAGLSDELEHARERIRERFAAQERFLSHVSHEIKTPLAIVLVEAHTLNTSSASDEVRRFVASTQDELTRVGRMLESLITHTRIRNRERTADALACGVADLALESLQACATMAGQVHAVLVPMLQGDEDMVDASVAGNPGLLRTMFESLVRNAIRYSPEHGRVEMRLSCDESSVTVSVLDQGPGVPPEVLPTVFDRYVPPSGAARKGRESSLGLAIAQGIAELHGGRIVATNRESGGSDFTVTLPRLQAAAPAPVDPATLPTEHDGAGRNGTVEAKTV